MTVRCFNEQEWCLGARNPREGMLSSEHGNYGERKRKKMGEIYTFVCVMYEIFETLWLVRTGKMYVQRGRVRNFMSKV